jgi:hypothetical protein
MVFTQDRVSIGQAAADVPQGSGEGLKGTAFRSVAAKKACQMLIGLGPITMEDQTGQQGLGFEHGGFGEWLIIATHLQYAEQV